MRPRRTRAALRAFSTGRSSARRLAARAADEERHGRAGTMYASQVRRRAPLRCRPWQLDVRVGRFPGVRRWEHATAPATSLAAHRYCEDCHGRLRSVVSRSRRTLIYALSCFALIKLGCERTVARLYHLGNGAAWSCEWCALSPAPSFFPGARRRLETERAAARARNPHPILHPAPGR